MGAMKALKERALATVKRAGERGWQDVEQLATNVERELAERSAAQKAKRQKGRRLGGKLSPLGARTRRRSSGDDARAGAKAAAGNQQGDEDNILADGAGLLEVELDDEGELEEDDGYAFTGSSTEAE